MDLQTIKKSIAINAPKEKVWSVLLNDESTRIWYAEFSEGSHADTDWRLGSKAVFTDKSKSGIVGKVIANKPYEVLSLEYEGVVKGGMEDYDSQEARNVKGSRETYKLSARNGDTNLSIECDMGSSYFEFMSSAWDKALQKIKNLSETT